MCGPCWDVISCVFSSFFGSVGLVCHCSDDFYVMRLQLECHAYHRSTFDLNFSFSFFTSVKIEISSSKRGTRNRRSSYLLDVASRSLTL